MEIVKICSNNIKITRLFFLFFSSDWRWRRDVFISLYLCYMIWGNKKKKTSLVVCEKLVFNGWHIFQKGKNKPTSTNIYLVVSKKAAIMLQNRAISADWGATTPVLTDHQETLYQWYFYSFFKIGITYF